MSRRTLISIGSFILFSLIAILVILLAQGYRLDRQTNTLYGTGILVVSTDPAGAVLTLNDEVKGATNMTINNLSPGSYSISLEKDGYFPWTKDVEIEASKVLTVDALMIPVSPSLSPISSTPAEETWLAPDGQKLVYTVTTGSSAGIWMLDLSSQPFNLARKPIQLVANTEVIAYSEGQIKWSPNSNDLLLTLPSEENELNYLLSVDGPQQPALISQPKATIIDQWAEEQADNFEELTSNYPEDVQEIIQSNQETVQWSPDNLKFMYHQEQDGIRTYRVYNKEKKEHTKVFEANTDTFVSIRWFADSHHLMMLEKESLETPTGSVSMVGMDGSNKQQIFSGTAIEDVLYSYLNGSKIIILTSFNIQEQSYYLYTINLR